MIRDGLCPSLPKRALHARSMMSLCSATVAWAPLSPGTSASTGKPALRSPVYLRFAQFVLNSCRSERPNSTSSDTYPICSPYSFFCRCYWSESDGAFSYPLLLALSPAATDLLCSLCWALDAHALVLVVFSFYRPTNEWFGCFKIGS